MILCPLAEVPRAEARMAAAGYRFVRAVPVADGRWCLTGSEAPFLVAGSPVLEDSIASGMGSSASVPDAAAEDRRRSSAAPSGPRGPIHPPASRATSVDSDASSWDTRGASLSASKEEVEG